MKDMTKEEWEKESRYLYLKLKEMHEMWTELQIHIQDKVTPEPKVMDLMIETSWKVYCIENNIKPEDYEHTAEVKG